MGPTFAVFVSGTGRTLKYIAEDLDAGIIPGAIGLVVSSRDCPAVEFARERGIPTRVERGSIDAPSLVVMLEEAGCTWVVLAGYTRLLPVPPALAGRMVNIHPALLPSFGGSGMYGARVHQAVIDCGCRVSGCTVHLCDDAYDTGPIVAQACCEVLPDDSAEALAARVFQLERQTYPAALAALFSARVSITGRRVRIMPE
ncbi:MAG: phosphoribosylglycinamide formyltransferase [Planctomycetota bacterium]